MGRTRSWRGRGAASSSSAPHESAEEEAEEEELPSTPSPATAPNYKRVVERDILHRLHHLRPHLHHLPHSFKRSLARDSLRVRALNDIRPAFHLQTRRGADNFQFHRRAPACLHHLTFFSMTQSCTHTLPWCKKSPAAGK